MAARAENEAHRHSALGVDALAAVRLAAGLDISREAEAGVQYGPVSVAFGTLHPDIHCHEQSSPSGRNPRLTVETYHMGGQFPAPVLANR